MPTMSAYLVVFLVALGVTVVATPLVRRVAIRRGVVAEPSDRAVHATAMPLLGGAAIAALARSARRGRRRAQPRVELRPHPPDAC